MRRSSRFPTRDETPDEPDADAARRAYEAGMRFLAPRPRSVAEMRWKLHRKHAAPAVDEAIRRLTADGYLDDGKFVAYWLEQRRSFSPRGSRALRAELRAKGVDSGRIDVALADVQDEGDLAVQSGRRLVERAQARGQLLEPKRLASHLGRRGFGFGVIREATARLLAPDAEQVASDAAAPDDDRA